MPYAFSRASSDLLEPPKASLEFSQDSLKEPYKSSKAPLAH